MRSFGSFFFVLNDTCRLHPGGGGERGGEGCLARPFGCVWSGRLLVVECLMLSISFKIADVCTFTAVSQFVLIVVPKADVL